jgi:cell wall-associated NlpC family hydrolase/LysM repeat protein
MTQGTSLMGHNRTINKHRKPSKISATAVRTSVTVATLTGLTAAGAVATGGAAQAASVSTWDVVAKCESSGNWAINTGNGYYGGLQFTPSTWAAYGGRAYAPQANQASKAQQITVAEKVLASQGPGAWPHCSVVAGLTGGGGAPYKAAPKKVTTKAKTTTKKTTSKKVTSGTAARAASFAKAQVGKPYVYGATGPNSYDCSGLTQAAWRAAGIHIPRTSQAQWHGLHRVDKADIRIGDLVVYYGGASHIALYIGGGKVVEAPRPGRSIRISKMYSQPVLGVVRPTGSTTGAAHHSKPRVATKAAAGAKTRPAPKWAAKPEVRAEAVHGPVRRAPGAQADKGQYKVVSGDYLSAIAMEHNVKGGWPALYAANASVVGSNPDLIFPGQVLALP